MRLILAIGLGGFIGSVSRYLLVLFIHSKFLHAFPYGTLAVNITGCLLIGFLHGLSQKFLISEEWRLMIATGLLGGFTTFSAFSIESIYMLRDGHTWPALLYIGVSVLFCLLAAYLGLLIFELVHNAG